MVAGYRGARVEASEWYGKYGKRERGDRAGVTW